MTRLMVVVDDDTVEHPLMSRFDIQRITANRAARLLTLEQSEEFVQIQAIPMFEHVFPTMPVAFLDSDPCHILATSLASNRGVPDERTISLAFGIAPPCCGVSFFDIFVRHAVSVSKRDANCRALSDSLCECDPWIR